MRNIVVCDEPLATPSNLINFMRKLSPWVPIIGRVAAGEPLLAEEHAEETLLVDPFFTEGVVRTSLAWSLAASR